MTLGCIVATLVAFAGLGGCPDGVVARIIAGSFQRPWATHMTIPPTRFRQLLLLYALCSIAGIVAGFVPGGYSNGLAQAYTLEPDAWLVRNTWVFLGLALVFAATAIAGVVGLFLFKAWGRTLSLVSTLLSLVMLPLLGPTLQSPMESSMYTAGSLAWGAALALAYYSPIAGRFGAGAHAGSSAAARGEA